MKRPYTKPACDTNQSVWAHGITTIDFFVQARHYDQSEESPLKIHGNLLHQRDHCATKEYEERWLKPHRERARRAVREVGHAT